MAVSLQVLYPATDGATFDYDYYLASHMGLVGEIMGPFFSGPPLVTKGLAGGPDVPAGYFATASMTFADQDALNGALGAAGPVLADIPNYFSGAPEMLIGEVIG